jgi:hypothetical protein
MVCRPAHEETQITMHLRYFYEHGLREARKARLLLHPLVELAGICLRLLALSLDLRVLG